MLAYRTLLLLLLAGAAVCGCSSSGKGDPGEPVFSVQLFSGQSAVVDNPYFPLVPGTVHVYAVETADGIEIVVVEVLDTTRTVAGVLCAAVRDRVYLDELLLEDTEDWYAQDMAGNVWYMGESAVNYEYDDDGNLLGTDTGGSWEAGADVAGTGMNAQPGIVMKATLVPGDSYRQEFYPGEAEDMGAVFALNVRVTLADGRTYTCLQTRDWNPLEPGQDEFKYYAPGIGLVLEQKTDGSDRGEYKGTFELEGSLPDFGAATFTNPAQVTNLHLMFTPLTARNFVDAGEDPETIVVEPLVATRMVNGIECLVVRDRVFVDELLVEDTHDWYAQDDAGNVWYMGEDVVNYEYDDDGNLLGTNSDGAWEAGVDGAEAGILMWASPQVGGSYRQEFYEDEAEDMAVVVATGVTVVLSDGTTYGNCLQVLEWTPLEPFALEYKYYAPGVGVVLEEPLDGSAPVEFLGAFDTSLMSLPDFGLAMFSNPSAITNTHLPYAPGATWEYENDTEDGLETILVEVLLTTRTVNGIECAVVRDRVFLDGLLIEDTHDWYAQDDDGNVWYMGEDVVNYEYDENDVLLGTNNDGAWESGVDGAEPGILMWAAPPLRQSYRQEYYEDEAEDMATVVARSVVVVLSDGTTYPNCLKILEWSPLDPFALEYKYYAPGVGVVLEDPVGSDERVELVSGP